MDVINTGKHIEIIAGFEETAVIVEGLRKAKTAFEIAGNWDTADQVAKVIKEITAAKVRLY